MSVKRKGQEKQGLQKRHLELCWYLMFFLDGTITCVLATETDPRMGSKV